MYIFIVSRENVEEEKVRLLPEKRQMKANCEQLEADEELGTPIQTTCGTLTRKLCSNFAIFLASFGYLGLLVSIIFGTLTFNENVPKLMMDCIFFGGLVMMWIARIISDGVINSSETSRNACWYWVFAHVGQMMLLGSEGINIYFNPVNSGSVYWSIGVKLVRIASGTVITLTELLMLLLSKGCGVISPTLYQKAKFILVVIVLEGITVISLGTKSVIEMSPLLKNLTTTITNAPTAIIYLNENSTGTDLTY